MDPTPIQTEKPAPPRGGSPALGAALATAFITTIVVAGLLVVPLRMQRRRLTELEAVAERLAEQKRLNGIAASTVRLTRSPGLRVIDLTTGESSATTRPTIWGRLFVDSDTGAWEFCAGGLSLPPAGGKYVLTATVDGQARALATVEADYFGEIVAGGDGLRGAIGPITVAAASDAAGADKARVLLSSH